MSIDFDHAYFGIKEQLEHVEASSRELNRVLISQLLGLSKRDWLDMLEKFTKEEMLDIILRLLCEIKDFREDTEQSYFY